MSGIKSRILRDIKRDKVSVNYNEKDRWIPSKVYSILKRRKKCDYCDKYFGKIIPEIHHRIPLSLGGKNELDNLMAVHSNCHLKLDHQQGLRLNIKEV